jgi:hypothetical protein
MRMLLTWNSRKPPAHRRTRTIARIKNIRVPPYLRLSTWYLLSQLTVRVLCPALRCFGRVNCLLCCDWITEFAWEASTYKSQVNFWRHAVLIVIIILLLLVFGTFPSYPYSRNWGYYPSGGLGTILLIVVILWLLHVI